MRRLICATVFCLFGIVYSKVTLAQSLCTLDDSVNSCLKKYAPTRDTAASEVDKISDMDVAKSSSKNQELDLLKKVAGISLQNSGFASTIQNFLPDFSFFGLINQEDDNGNGDDLGLQYNFGFPNSKFGHNTQVEFKPNQSPAIFPALKESLGADAGAVAAIDNSIDSFDEYSFSISYSYNGKLFGQSIGRSFPIYRKLYEKLYIGVSEIQSVSDVQNVLDEALIRFTGHSDLPDTVEEPTALDTKKFSEYPNPGSIMQSTEEFGQAEKHYIEAKESNIEKFGLTKFIDFVNNQPQLIFTLKQESRTGAVGPDQTTLGINYEMGFMNINKVNEQTRDKCPTLDVMQDDVSDVCLRSYVNFLKSSEAEAKKARRLSFTLEYTDVSDFNFRLANGTIFNQPNMKKFTAGIAYGQNILFEDALNNTRFDLSIDYEKATEGDQDKDDRLVGSISLTKKINDISIPFSIVYANRTEFLTDVDKEVSAHIGLKYDF